MTLAEKLVLNFNELNEIEQREVVDFVEFLKHKKEKESKDGSRARGITGGKEMAKEKIIGIDLGTTNSCVAVMVLLN